MILETKSASCEALPGLEFASETYYIPNLAILTALAASGIPKP